MTRRSSWSHSMEPPATLHWAGLSEDRASCGAALVNGPAYLAYAAYVDNGMPMQM